MILTYKYRLKDKTAAKHLRQHAFAVNQVWNWCNGQQKDIEQRYRAGAPKLRWPSHFDLARQCRGVGAELSVHQQTVQEVCRQFVVSRDKRKASVRFRASSGSKRSLGWVPFQTQSRQIEGNSVTYLGKKFRWFGSKRRPLPESAKGGAFVEDASGRWYVTFHAEVADLPKGAGQVGIDLGLKTLATCSDGTTVASIQPLRKWAERLAIAQRARNRKRVKAIHQKIKNIRADHLHKASARIANDNAVIVVGNVSSSRLAKTKMAKSIYDAGWYKFKEMLRYKASRHGASFEEVDEKFTTQTCSECGSLPPGRPKGIAGLRIREWSCADCGAVHDRDVNAAKNILAQSALRPVGGRLLARAA